MTPVQKLFSLSGSVELQPALMDLNRETVEYICRRFKSPYLSRKYGHKLYDETEDPFLRAMRSLSEVQ